jgi:hypothetical protein
VAWWWGGGTVPTGYRPTSLQQSDTGTSTNKTEQRLRLQGYEGSRKLDRIKLADAIRIRSFGFMTLLRIVECSEQFVLTAWEK